MCNAEMPVLRVEVQLSFPFSASFNHLEGALPSFILGFLPSSVPMIKHIVNLLHWLYCTFFTNINANPSDDRGQPKKTLFRWGRLHLFLTSQSDDILSPCSRCSDTSISCFAEHLHSPSPHPPPEPARHQSFPAGSGHDRRGQRSASLHGSASLRSSKPPAVNSSPSRGQVERH